MNTLLGRTAALCAAALAIAGCSNMKTIKHRPYPAAERGDVVDDYFGVAVADPYRWLEDDTSEATAAWVAAENAVTQDYLAQIPFRGAIRERLTELWNYAKESAPAKHGDWWYYSYNDGLQNQSVLYRTKRPGEPGEVFLDPNALSEDGTVALSAVSFSKDGRYFAYAASASGSDWVEIRVLDTETLAPTGDRIEWVKFSGAVWAPRLEGLLLQRLRRPEGERAFGAEPLPEGLLPCAGHPAVGRPADLRGSAAPAALLPTHGPSRRRPLALRRGLGGHVGHGGAL